MFDRFDFMYFFGLHFYLAKFSEMFKMRQKLALVYLKDNNKASSAVNTFNSSLPI